MSCIRGHDVVIVHFYSMKFKNPRFKMARGRKVGVASRGGRTSAAAAAAAAVAGAAESSSNDSSDEDPPPKNSVKGKSAADSARDEVDALIHEAAASASPSRARNPPKPSANGAKASAALLEQADATSDRVKELERQKKQREAAEAQAAAIQKLEKLEAENLRLKRKLQLEQKAESIPRKAPKKRRSSAERRENLVNAVFAMWVLSVIV